MVYVFRLVTFLGCLGGGSRLSETLGEGVMFYLQLCNLKTICNFKEVKEYIEYFLESSKESSFFIRSSNTFGSGKTFGFEKNV